MCSSSDVSERVSFSNAFDKTVSKRMPESIQIPMKIYPQRLDENIGFMNRMHRIPIKR